MDNDEIIRTILVEDNISNFADFHDELWVENMFNLIKNTSLEQIAGNFAINWWGNARAFLLPWLLATGVSDSLSAETPNFVRINSTPQNVWKEYVQNIEFNIGLWKLSENTYCSIYFAYENLIVNVLKAIYQDKIRVTQKDFDKKLKDIYGEEFTQKIWLQPFIYIARETRSSIVHNGGKVTANLLQVKPPPYYIQEGNVVISAAVTRDLFIKLSPLAYDFIEESLRIIQSKSANDN
ncbi:MAG: hypothetical protein H6636_12335 [Anaerolineales bacterium]|nr:hypothetical protein [Anaerolineales bacterium]